MEGKGWKVGISPTDGSDVEGGVTGGGDLHLPPPEHSLTVQCNKTHYGPVSGGGETSGVTSVQAVVGAGSLGMGGDVDSGQEAEQEEGEKEMYRTATETD